MRLAAIILLGAACGGPKSPPPVDPEAQPLPTPVQSFDAGAQVSPPTTEAPDAASGDDALSTKRLMASTYEARVINSAIVAERARFMACRRDPKLRGRLVVTFTVGTDGAVTSASGAGFPDATVTDCIVAIIRGIRFPVPPRDQPATVRYPFVFEEDGP